MIDQTPADLAKHRFIIAEEHLAAAKSLISSSHFRDSISPSYYAVLSAARSILALKGLDSKSHAGVIALFGQQFIKLGILPEKCLEILGQSRAARWKSDYGDYEVVTAENAAEQLDNAAFFLAEIQKALTKELGPL